MNLKPISEDPEPFILSVESAAEVDMHPRRLSAEDETEVRALISEGFSLREISSAFGISHVAIWKLKEGLTYKETQA